MSAVMISGNDNDGDAGLGGQEFVVNSLLLEIIGNENYQWCRCRFLVIVGEPLYRHFDS